MIMAVVQKHDNYEIKSFRNSASFETWLKKHHEKKEGIWIKMAKAATGITSITHPEALDVALCYGWIDGLRRGLDDSYFLQKFTPRTATSLWSVINKAKVARLIGDGRMQEAGLKVIEVAKKNGRWANAYDSPKNMKPSPKFTKALNASPKAKKKFMSLTAQARYVIMLELAKTVKEELRDKKMLKYIEKLAGADVEK
jgi:uncharacterized protein YdeI (YjbR/CyaY-like superfamily)